MAKFRYFPLSYDVDGRSVLVAGDGAQALQKLRLLVRSKARLTLVADRPDADLSAFIAAHQIARRDSGDFEALLADAALVFLAIEDEAKAAILSERARAAGIPVNVVDRPHLSDFAVPAIVDRAPISVAIASDGFAPVLAQRVRAVVEAALPPGFGQLGELAQTLRRTVMERLTDGASRRKFWARLFDGEAGRQALAGNASKARRLALKELDRATGETAKGFVSLVGAGPGAEDLLTLRAQRLLQAADVIVFDALVPEAIVAMGRRDAERISVGKRKGRHSVPQGEINALLVRLAQDGKTVVRLKAGDPLVFGRIGEEMAALRQAGIDFDIVPGITAAFAAAADAKIPLTQRGLSSHIIFATGHGADGAEPQGYAALAASGATIALYMGKSVADRTSRELIDAGLPPTMPVAVVENAGRPERRILTGTLAELALLAGRDDLAGPALILVGLVVAEGEQQLSEAIAAALEAAA